MLIREMHVRESERERCIAVSGSRLIRWILMSLPNRSRTRLSDDFISDLKNQNKNKSWWNFCFRTDNLLWHSGVSSHLLMIFHRQEYTEQNSDWQKRVVISVFSQTLFRNNSETIKHPREQKFPRSKMCYRKIN